MSIGSNTRYVFLYDATGPMTLRVYNGTAVTTYYYVRNLQGDIIAILNTAGKAVVEYTYDAWGNVLTVTGEAKDTIGQNNPLLYRGYVYDRETKLYYLQSRYYDPSIGRFLNADDYASTGKDFIGYNMFAYCNNNPIMHRDSSGKILVGAIVGGAVGGALISVVSHLTTNPNATVGSTSLALVIGAVTGALGGWAGVVTKYKAIISISAGAIAGVYAGATASGNTLQRVGTGLVTFAIASIGTYGGAQFDTSGSDRFGTAAANYATTILVGSVAEPVTVAAQQHIANATPEKSTTQGRTPAQQRKWELMRKKELRLLLSKD